MRWTHGTARERWAMGTAVLALGAVALLLMTGAPYAPTTPALSKVKGPVRSALVAPSSSAAPFPIAPTRGTAVGHPVLVASLGPGGDRSTVAPPPAPRYPSTARPAAFPAAGVAPSPRTTATPGAAPAGISLGAQFEGANFNNCGCSPPDVQVADGPSQVVEFVNVEGVVSDPADGATLSSFALGTFFGAGGNYLSDPRILYDNLTGRWVASILDIGSTGRIDLAVSQGSNALGNWTVYGLTMPTGRFGDQPILGLGSSTIGLGATLFWLSNGSYAGGMYWVVNKSAALSGAPLSYQGFGPDFSASSYHPVDAVSPTSTLYMVMTSYGGATSYLDLFNLTGVPPATVSVTETPIPIRSITMAPSAVQPGTTTQLDTGDARVQTAVWSGGLLWVGFNDQCQVAGDTQARACVRLVEVATSNTTVLQDFDLGVSGTYLYYPAFALDNAGDLTVVYGESSSTVSPSIEVTGRRSSDPVGTLASPLQLIGGSSSMACGTSVCRFGDYFGAGLSPAAPGAWVAGEYIGNVTSWQTRVGFVRVAGPATPRLTATPATVEVGETFNATLDLVNSTCVAGSPERCSVGLPLLGSAYSQSCVNPFSGARIPVVASTAGLHSLGAGGYVALYSAAPCTAASLVANLSVSPVALQVVADPTVRLVSAPVNGTEVGQNATFTVLLAGGIGPFTLVWSSLPPGCAPSNATTIRCVPSVAGAGTVRVTATDSHGFSASASLPFAVAPALAVDLTVARAIVETGQTLAWSANASGGTGSYSYAWRGLPTGCPPLNAAVVTCPATATGTFVASVVVNDSDNFGVVSGARPVTVVAGPVVTLQVLPSSPSAGAGVTFTASVSEGAPPFEFLWSGLPAGCAASNQSTIRCSPSASGDFRASVEVSDALGGAARAQLNGTVAPSGAFLGLGPLVLVALVAAVVAVAVAALVLAARRRRSVPPPEDASG